MQVIVLFVVCHCNMNISKRKYTLHCHKMQLIGVAGGSKLAIWGRKVVGSCRF